MTYKDIKGFMTFEEVYDLIVDRMPAEGGRFVEVGTFQGQSLAYFIQKCIEEGKQVETYGVDLFHGGTYNQFVRNMFQLGLNALIRPLHGDSSLIAMQFDDQSLDACFIDGDNRYESTLRDVKAWLPKVRPGGLIGGDHWHLARSRRAVEDVIGVDKVVVYDKAWVYLL